MVLEYYVVLRSILRSNPQLCPCLKHCRRCGIFFLTHPCNARRTDLCCPFGCREVHRRGRDNERVAAYYRKYPDEKRRHNRNRYLQEAERQEQIEKTEESAVDAPHGQEQAPMTDYLRMVVGLIEGRRVSRDEIAEMMKRIWRQHRVGARRKVDYIVAELNENPP